MNRLKLRVVPLSLALLFNCTMALADGGDDTLGFHGYLRDGIGSSSAGGGQSCYGLRGDGTSFRLGNECDSYAEFGYTGVLGAKDGVSFVGTFWINDYAPNPNFSGNPSIAKLYVEAKGLDFLNGGTAWIGERYYVRPDIHMLDLQFINLNGTGAGFDKINWGPGKFSYAVFEDRNLSLTDPLAVTATDTATTGPVDAIRQNLIYQGLPVNDGGKIDVITSFITARKPSNIQAAEVDTNPYYPDQTKTHNGYQFTVLHNQDKPFGVTGGNTLGFQYGVGAGTGIGSQSSGADGICCNRMGPSGSTLLGSDVTRTRVFDSFWFQPDPHMGIEGVALVQKDKSNEFGTSTMTDIGVRPIYALTNNFKLQMEIGNTRITNEVGYDGQTENLTKVTFAPTLSLGPGVWDRPELRLFVTYGKWSNNAATFAALNANNNTGAVYNGGTTGTSVGLQVEAWW